MTIMFSDKQAKTSLPFQKKIILVLFGIGFSIVLLELVLRLGGFIFSFLQEYRNRIEIQKKGTYRIMCLGESTTAVGGENSYPSQLEEILNHYNLGIKFSVINRGLIAVNSTAIISHLEENLNKYKPDMVCVMMGVNDEYLKYYKDIPDADSFLFKNFRVYRLTKLLWIDVVMKMKRDYSALYGISGLKESYEDRLNIVEKEGILKKTIETNPRNIKAHLELGFCYRQEGKHSESQATYEKLIELDPANDNAYVQLAFCYIDQGKSYLAGEALKKAIELNPRNDNAYAELGRLYRDSNKYPEAVQAFRKAFELKSRSDSVCLNLGLCWTYLGEYIQAERAFQRAIKLNPRNDKAYGGLAVLYKEMGNYAATEEYYKKANSLRTGYYNPITRYNYRRLKEILDKKGIKIICVQYPMRSITTLKKMFKEEDGIKFVDNEKIFKSALRGTSFREYFVDMFAGDFGHCTPRGNRLLAKNVADTILKECFNIKRSAEENEM